MNEITVMLPLLPLYHPSTSCVLLCTNLLNPGMSTYNTKYFCQYTIREHGNLTGDNDTVSIA